MSRKYEIVNVGGLSRVRALRSWVVQGRQVNVGDVGGAVFDERTLSQDGACWIFSGRLDNPLVRVGVATIKDNAVINTSIGTIGDITLCGGYVSTLNKKLTGKRVIDNDNEPQYDNNVKTQYDF